MSAPRFVNDYLGYLLGQANHALFKDFENEVRSAGLGSLEWRVLATLSDLPAMSIGQLAQEVLSQQPTVTKLVQRLQAHNWVQLTNDPQDQRRTLVHITPTGQRKVSPLIAKSRDHEARALAGLNAVDAQRLKDQLRQLAQGACATESVEAKPGKAAGRAMGHDLSGGAPKRER